MVDTRSNMQLADLNSKPHGGKSLRNLIDRAIEDRIYPPRGSEHYKLLCLDHFHVPSQIKCEQEKKSDFRMMKISNAHNCTMKERANQI